MSLSTFPERKWKRPGNVAPFPTVWHRLTVRNKNTGETYNIRIQDITPDRYDETWDLFVEQFYPDVAIYSSLNMSTDEESMASEKLFHYHTLTKNLSIIAVLDNEEAKPTILGCLRLEVISKDDRKSSATNESSSGKAEAAVDSLLVWLRGNISIFEKSEADYLIKELGLVVKREYREMGIGYELLRAMEHIARAFDIPAAGLDLANTMSQKMGARLGMSLLKEEKLIDCVDENGQKVLPTFDPEQTIQWGYLKYNLKK